MPIFQYDNYRNAYGPSIAEALAHQNDAPAQAALRLGDLQAQGAERTAALQGQLWTSLGTIPAQIAASNEAAQKLALQRQAGQLQAQQIQEGALTLQDAQAKRAAETQIGQLLDSTPRGPNGLYDVKGVAAQVPGNLSKYAQPYLDHMNAVNAAWEAEDTKRRGQLQQGAAALLQAGAPFLPTQSLIDTGERDGTLTADQATTWRRQLLEDPAGAKGVLAGLAGYQKPITKKDDESLVNPVTLQTLLPSTPKPDKPTEASLAVDAAKGDPTAIAALNRLKPAPDDQVIARLFGREAGGETLNAADKALLEGWKAKEGAKPYSVKTVVNGQPVEQVMTTAEAMKRGVFQSPPSAAVTVRNETANAIANLPAWALDDSRPTGADANKADPVIGRTPNGLYQDAVTLIQTGQYPNLGRSADARGQAVRAAIDAKVGAIAASSGMDVPQLRAFYKANQASLTGQQKLFDAAAANIATADRNADLLDQALTKMPDTGSPLLNQPLRAFQTRVVGDPAMAAIGTYLTSVQNEYGKLINSASGTGATLTDSARHEAQQLLDPTATVQQMLASIAALKAEGDNRLLSTGDQIKRIQGRMSIGGTGTASPSAAPASTKPKTDPLGLF